MSKKDKKNGNGKNSTFSDYNNESPKKPIKKIRKPHHKSSFSAGENAFVNNGANGFGTGEIVTVQDSYKYGKEHSLRVMDATGRVGYIPAKYLRHI